MITTRGLHSNVLRRITIVLGCVLFATACGGSDAAPVGAAGGPAPAPAPGPAPAPSPTPNPTPNPAPSGVTITALATFDAAVENRRLGIQGVALNADGSLLYVAEGSQTQGWNGTQCIPPSEPPSSAPGAVSIYDTSTRTRIARVPFMGGAGPIHMELDAVTNTVYATGSGGASGGGVYAYQGAAQVAYLPVNGLPHDTGIDTTNGHAIVSNTIQNSSTGYSLIDARGMTLLRTVDGSLNAPHKIAVDSDRHLAYLSHANDASADVNVVDTITGNLLRRISPAGLSKGAAQNAIDAARRRLFLPGPGPAVSSPDLLVVVDLDSEQKIGEFTLGRSRHGMRVDPATGLLWAVTADAGTLTVIDPSTMTARATVTVGHCPFYLDTDPVRHLAYVTNEGDLTISIVDTTRVPGTASASLPLHVLSDPMVRSEAATLNAANRILDNGSPLRVPLDHAIRERLARAEVNFRRGDHRGITASALADAFNAAAHRIFAFGYETSLEEIARVRAEAAPKVLLPASVAPARSPEMSPIEAVAVAMTLANARLDRDVDRASARWMAMRADVERMLTNEDSRASMILDAFVNELGVRR